MNLPMPNDKQQAALKQGLVIAYFGNSVAVEADDGQVFQCHLRRNQELPVVGDQVMWQRGDSETGTIEEIVKRRSLLSRADERGKLKAIAANIDAILVVMAPPPIFSEFLIDLYLVAAELLNIPATLVLNKIDLLNESNKDDALNPLTAYRQIPYPVILSSIYTQDGLVALGGHMKDKTVVLVGPSGVGKSSIIAAFCGTESIRVGDVSNRGSGKHTTTATRLYHLPQGGNVIDSPGVREFKLWAITKKEAVTGFKEFEPFLGHCKFRDCAHMAEPGCAVHQAVDDGKISPLRYANYQALMKKTATKK